MSDDRWELIRQALAKNNTIRCPGGWRCRNGHYDERHGYKTPEERNADLAAHYLVHADKLAALDSLERDAEHLKNALVTIAEGNVPHVGFAPDDLISAFAREALDTVGASA